MVMTGANAMMNNAANSSMMGSGVMMDMSMMGPMGMGMNGDMNMGGPMMQGMMSDNTQVQQQSGVGIVPANSTPEQVGNGIGLVQDGFSPGTGSGNMMNIGMSGDFGIQVPPEFILSEKPSNSCY